MKSIIAMPDSNRSMTRLPIKMHDRFAAAVVDEDRGVAGDHIVRVALLRWLRRCHGFGLGGELGFRSTAGRRFIVCGRF
ncbi:hypothetical protein [Salinispora mooreana]|uniref:hypothetical protein n=1 Tax=Salinispora mooreana TaxID=999545 RepID=UPI000368021C|nr:hypothetical protein [Salinispora mooreana]